MTQRLKRWVAPCSLRWFAEGAHCTNPKDGDVILVRHLGITADGISIGQRALSVLSEPELKGYTWNDHVALIRRAKGGERMRLGETRAAKDDWIVSEFGPRGHEYRPLEDYQSRLYCVVDFEVPDSDRAKVLAEDDRMALARYGFLTYVPLVIDGLSGAHFSGSYGTTMICSTAVTMCAMNLYFCPDRQPSGVVPAHISYWVGARPPA